MTEAIGRSKKIKKPKATKHFQDELIDQLLAWVQNKDPELVLCDF